VVWCVSPSYHSARVLDPGVGSFEVTSSRGDWRKEMEAEQRESAASATAIADAEDIESQRYRPCCERPDDSMSCIAHPASNRCRVVTKSTRLAANATVQASLGGQTRCAAVECAYFVNGYRPMVPKHYYIARQSRGSHHDCACSGKHAGNTRVRDVVGKE
jgi:hypothetical protein